MHILRRANRYHQFLSSSRPNCYAVEKRGTSRGRSSPLPDTQSPVRSFYFDREISRPHDKGECDGAKDPEDDILLTSRLVTLEGCHGFVLWRNRIWGDYF